MTSARLLLRLTWWLGALLIGCGGLHPSEPLTPTPPEGFRAEPPAIPSGVAALQLPDRHREALPSGAELWLAHTDRELATVCLVSRRGGVRQSLVESWSHELLAHVIAETQGIGELEGTVSSTHLRLCRLALPDEIEATLGGLARIVVASDLTGPHVERQRALFTERLGREIHSTTRFAIELARERLFSGMAMDDAFSRLGDITLSEVHAKVFSAESVAFVVVGPVDPVAAGETLVSALEREDLTLPEPSPSDPAPGASPRVTHADAWVYPSGLAQSFLALALAAPKPGSEEEASAAVLAELLAGMYGSRLNLALRERAGDAYAVHGRYGSSSGHGVIDLRTFVPGHRSSAALQRLLWEIDRLRREPVGADELASAKARIRQRLRRDLEQTRPLAHRLADAFARGADVTHFARWDEGIAAVSPADLLALADEYLPLRSPVIVLAPAEAAEGIQTTPHVRVEHRCRPTRR